MAIYQQLKELVEDEGSQQSLAEKAGLSQAQISSIITRGEKGQVRSGTIEAILKAYPNLSCRWLLFGEGEKYLPEKMGDSEREELEKKVQKLTEETEKQSKALEKINKLLEQRVAALELLIKENAPDLAEKLGL